MAVIARGCRYVPGRSETHGGAGDSSVLTAWGLYQGMRAAAEHVWDTPRLAGRRVGVSGLGKVGNHLIGHLVEDGAEVVGTDVAEPALAWVRDRDPEVDLVDDDAALIRSDVD